MLNQSTVITSHCDKHNKKLLNNFQSLRMLRLNLLFAVIVFFHAGGAFASEENVFIKLNHGGYLEGTELKTEAGRSTRAFLGIPYAKAPVGKLRFKVKF